MKPFTETQRFRQRWLWLLLGFVACVSLPAALSAKGQSFWVPILILTGVVWLFLVMRLETEIREEGVRFRFFPFLERTIPWQDIRTIEVRSYSPLAEYGGWGIRLGLSGWAYNVAGNWGLQIVKTNGRRILIGTQRPEALREAIRPFTVQA